MHYEKQKIADVASLLTGKIRISIIELLLDGSWIVSDIVEKLQFNQAVVSKQLAVLKIAGLVKCSPAGRCREYALTDAEMMKEVMSSLSKMAEICEITVKNEN
jgi:predicted transcriptional regulator